jgi:hypothetical protein
MENKTGKTGRLRSWNERGYGIIQTDVRAERYFLHTNSIVVGPEIPAVGSIIHFNVAPPYKNGVLQQAVDAVIDEAPENSSGASR